MVSVASIADGALDSSNQQDSPLCPTRAALLNLTVSFPEAAAKPEAALTDWVLWQLVDSAFPTGGYAHSVGLEAAWHHGEITNAESLVSFIEATLQQLGRSVLPFVTAAHDDPARLEEWDALCDAFTTNHVANRASRLQGRAWISAVARIFPPERRPASQKAGAPGNGRSNDFMPPKDMRPAALPLFQALRCGHFAPVFGASAQSFGLPRATAIRLFFFHQLRGLMAAAVRLNIVGPIEAQRLQHRFGLPIQELIDRCSAFTLEDLAQTAPLLDLWQGAHDRLYSRLFQS